MFRYLWQAPVTFISLVVLAMVFAGTHGVAGQSPRELSMLRRAWGSVEGLTWVQTVGNRAEIPHPELHGPFDLWDGEWWRIPLSSLHHVAFWHLFTNLLATATLGRVLEMAWGSWRYLLFLVTAAFVSLLPEFLLQNYAIGYSGVLCAMFGALLVLRERDPVVAAQVTREAVVVTLVCLVGMAALTWLADVPIANVAHFTGLAYGWCVAKAGQFCWPVRAGMVCAHALLVIPYWLVTHPTWEGRYHWYRAGLTETGQIAKRQDPAQLQLAVSHDRTLSDVWLLLAEDTERQHRPLEAFRLVLQGLQAQPTDIPLWDSARRLWRRLTVDPQRDTAVIYIHELFGEGSLHILDELRRMRPPPPVLIAPDRPIGRPPEPRETVAERPDWQPSSDETWRALTRPLPHSPTLDPADPRSALEGELL
ncbi:MAG: rhomboid family intramembrane serine protease [Planctomycetaceae bacterium]|nr:rhomboid family intramembrane serine protease [Planctomycetaceae bacterium]